MSGEDQELSHTARVGVSLERALDTDPGPILEIIPGASLGVELGPTARAALMVAYRAYAPSPQMDLCPNGE